MAGDDRLTQAHVLLAVRVYRGPEAPFGVLGGFDVGGVYVSRENTDLVMLLIGLRKTPDTTVDPPEVWPPADQTWATPSDVAQAGLNTTFGELTVGQQANLTRATDAARAALTTYVSSPWGVA